MSNILKKKIDVYFFDIFMQWLYAVMVKLTAITYFTPVPD